MGLSNRYRSLESAVSRLEAAAGKGQRYCAYCRSAQYRPLPGSNEPKPRPEDLLKRKCDFCYSECTTNFAGLPAEEREVWRLFFSYTEEDRFTDPKAHAVTMWWSFRAELKELRKPRAAAKRSVKGGAANKSLDEFGRILARKHKKLRAKYGEPFPEQRQLIDSIENRKRRDAYAPGLADLEREETCYLAWAEMEKIFRGEVRAVTAAAIQRIAGEIDELIRAAQEEGERRRQESGPTTLELVNRSRELRGLPPLPG
jgi:hypothetical protein